MTLLSSAAHRLRAIRQRRAIHSLAALDDCTLADIGLLRADVHAALARPYFAAPSKALMDACCRRYTIASRFRAEAASVASF